MTKEIIEQLIEQLENLENITLHFQERGQRINVRAYAGYDRSAKRSSYVLLGSLDKYTLEQNDRLQSVVERSERIACAFNDAVEKYTSERKAETEKDHRNSLKSGVHWYAGRLAEALEAMAEDRDEITTATATDVYAAIKRTESVLRKAGHKKTTITKEG